MRTPTGRITTWRPETQRAFGGTLDSHFQQMRHARARLDADFCALEQRVKALGGKISYVMDEIVIELPPGVEP